MNSLSHGFRIKADVLKRTNRLLSFDGKQTAKKTERSAILLFLRVYSLPQ
jgi:hypothetical protein